MNFEEVLPALRAGKKVKFSGKDNTGALFALVFDKDEKYGPNTIDILSEGWEVVEEEDELAVILLKTVGLIPSSVKIIADAIRSAGYQKLKWKNAKEFPPPAKKVVYRNESEHPRTFIGKIQPSEFLEWLCEVPE